MTTTSSPVPVYVNSYTGERYDERQSAIIEGTREDLLSGRAFSNVWLSSSSVRCYEPPVGRRAWSHAMGTLARMAVESDALAQVAAAIMTSGPNLYGTPSQTETRIWRAASKALEAGYDDVLGRSGPEAGRPSSYHRDFTFAERVLLYVWLREASAKVMSCVPGLGWCIQAIIASDEIYGVSARKFPSLHLDRA